MLHSVRAHMIFLSLLLGLTMSLDLVSGKTPTRISLGGVNVTTNTFPIIMVGNDDNSLVCYIDDATNTVWLFPNGTEVTSGSRNEVPTDTIIYFKLQFVLIPDRVYLRRGPSVRSPGGSYCCGSATNVTLRLCVNLVVDCELPPSISNGSPGTQSTTQLGGSVTYTCDNGYQISPGIKTATASCLATGNWETVPTCLPVDCGIPPSISNGSPGTPTDTTFGGTVTYICNSGYRTSLGTTMATVSCLATGNWETVPTCLPVDCGLPPLISNGSPGTPTDTTFGGTVTYICNSGYRTSLGTTMATVSCLATGNWETIPTCLATCPSLNPMENVDVITYQPPGTILLESTIATHSCISQATNLSSSERVCQSNGTWSGNPYACLAIRFTPSENTPTLGQSFSLTVTLTGAEHLNLSISYQWIKMLTKVGNNSATLTFNPLELSDSGFYSCNVTVSENTESVNLTIMEEFNLEIPTVFFQIIIRGINNCSKYTECKGYEILQDVTDELIKGVQEFCVCGFNSNHITKSFLKCFSENPEQVAFRAELSQTSEVSTKELVSYLDQWMRHPGHLIVQGSLLQIDTTCSQVITDQFMTSACSQSSSGNQSSLPPCLSCSQCSNAAAIASSITIIFVAFFVLLAVTAVAIAHLVLRQRRVQGVCSKKYTSATPRNDKSQSSNHEKANIADVTYEEMIVPGTLKGSYEYTQCQAYGTTHGCTQESVANAIGTSTANEDNIYD